MDPKLIHKMEAEEIDFPKEFVRQAAEWNLLGKRFKILEDKEPYGLQI